MSFNSKILNTLNDEKFPIVTIAVKDSLDPKSSDQLLILTFSEIPGNKTKDSLIKQLSGLGFKADFKSMEKMNRDNMLVVVVRNTP